MFLLPSNSTLVHCVFMFGLCMCSGNVVHLCLCAMQMGLSFCGLYITIVTNCRSEDHGSVLC